MKTLTLVGALVLVAPAPALAAGASPLKVQVDTSKVDLAEHRLEVKMSHPAGKVKIRVVTESEAELADEEHDFTGRRAGTPLIVTWSPSSDAPMARIELQAYDASGRWQSYELTSWSVAIPHQDVNFKTDSADIEDGEVPKLESAYAKFNEVLEQEAKHRPIPNLTLYIIGHTDTVGGEGHNLTLSQARARSIAAWFRKRGVRLPIAYEGFGETALKVRTADNVDEPRNRRADYILTNLPPPIKSSGGFRPAWKKIP
jgi:outer membrane protein OmpA-like peptidoglycan-associated protein